MWILIDIFFFLFHFSRIAICFFLLVFAQPLRIPIPFPMHWHECHSCHQLIAKIRGYSIDRSKASGVVGIPKVCIRDIEQSCLTSLSFFWDSTAVWSTRLALACITITTRLYFNQTTPFMSVVKTIKISMGLSIFKGILSRQSFIKQVVNFRLFLIVLVWHYYFQGNTRLAKRTREIASATNHHTNKKI